jgi:hypothetical protein
MHVSLPVRFDKSEIVLFGRVEAVRYVDARHPTPPPPSGATHYVATIRVQELWKGSTPHLIELHQSFVGGGLALDQHIGSTYLFFLRRLTPQQPLSHPFAVVTSGYHADECHTQRFQSPEQFRRELGRSYAPRID